jgi:hypothetical protein
VVIESLQLDSAALAARTGWELKPEGACKGERCVPMPDGAVDARVVAERLSMALVADERHGLWALGPESGGHALLTAELPDITLPDRAGEQFSLRSLRDTKVFLLAWASW